MLRVAGHDVTLVGNGEEALDALAVARFDLVLMDLNMPVMGGLDAVKLHRFGTGGRNLPPVVALTADATEETRRQCVAAGVDAYVTKPAALEELLALIERLTRPGAARPDAAGATAEDGLTLSRAELPKTDPGGLPVLDPALLDRLRELDDDEGFLVQLIEDFIADAEQLIGELEASAAAADAPTFRDRVHALRSSAAHIGASALFELCLAWRGIGAAELAERGVEHVARLRFEFDRLRRALVAELAAPRARPVSPPR